MCYENLKRIREEKGYTQKHLAKLLNISQSDYSMKENGKRSFFLKESLVLSEFLMVNVNELFK